MKKLRFPNEPDDYRHARDRLLEAEKSLRRHVEEVAVLRRHLPPGGEVPEDYLFEGERGPLRLSQLFTRGGTLVAYSFMYGPKMAHACPMCTSMLDALDGNAQHIAQRTDLVVIAKSPLARIQEHARSRGWRNLRLLSSAQNSYNRDYHGEDAEGNQMPMLNVFVKRGSALRHSWGSELIGVPADPGQNQRHVDMLWPLWHLLDLTPEGRGTDWYPKLEY